MDAAALCIRLLMDVLFMLVLQVDLGSFAHKANAARPRVSPDSQQFFEYEMVSVSCEEFTGPTEWRVMRKLSKITPTDPDNWNSSAPSCNITAAFAKDSGKYWCEDAEGNTSGAVNITVTAGSVILDVPARPVVEGHDVVLHCRKKDSESVYFAEFYKDGLYLSQGYEGSITLLNVSKSDEGLYKCRIPRAGESLETWLAVVNQGEEANEETPPSLSRTSSLFSALWTITRVVMLMMLVLVVIGLLLRWKCKGAKVSRGGIKQQESSIDESVHT